MYVRSRPSLKALKTLNANRRLLKQDRATDTDPVAFDSIVLYYLRTLRTYCIVADDGDCAAVGDL